MFFVYCTSILFIKTNTISHNCSITNVNQSLWPNESIDYQIACESHNVQRISLSNRLYDNFISIYDYSNVIIDCSNLINISSNLYLSIYGEPDITFQNYCNINKIEIHGSPSFRFSSNSYFFVDTLILYNQNYSFPFDYNNIFYMKNISKKFISSINSASIQDFSDDIFQCGKTLFNVTLHDDYVIARCGNFNEKKLLYSSLLKKSYFLYNKKILITNNINSDELAEKNVKIVLKSFNFLGYKAITFKNFSNIYKLDFFSLDKNSNITKTWLHLESYYFPCLWETNLTDDYQDLVDKGWKKVCLGDETYLFCCDTDLGPRKMNIISKGGFIAIVVVIILVIFIIFGSLCIIASVRYKNPKRIQNFTKNA